MKHLLLAIAIFIPSTLWAQNQTLEYELIRTAETPGFFAVTIYPNHESTPVIQEHTFVKNFAPSETIKYKKILEFLSEIGANVLDQKPTNSDFVSLGKPFQKEKNFQARTQNSFEDFEDFTIRNLPATYLRDITAEFGGNISSISQTQNNLTGDSGTTFIGKFEKDMRTRMKITGHNQIQTFSFETPLDLSDKSLSNSPLASQLPNLWEKMQPQKIHSTNNFIDLFPWIIGAIGLLILVFFFIRNTRRKYNEFLEEQNNLQEELPWTQIKQSEAQPTNPFEVN